MWGIGVLHTLSESDFNSTNITTLAGGYADWWWPKLTLR